jgi:hypothetical protein
MPHISPMRCGAILYVENIAAHTSTNQKLNHPNRPTTPGYQTLSPSSHANSDIPCGLRTLPPVALIAIWVA